MNGIPPHLMQQGVMAAGAMAGRNMSRFGAGVVRQPLSNMTAPPPPIGNMQGVLAQLANVQTLPTISNPMMQSMMQMPTGFPQGGMAGMPMQGMGINPQGMGMNPYAQQSMPPYAQAAMQYQAMQAAMQQGQMAGYAQQGGQPQGQMSSAMQGAMGEIVGSAGMKAFGDWLGGKPAGEAVKSFQEKVKTEAVDKTSGALAEKLGLKEKQADTLKERMEERFLGMKEKKASEEEKPSTASKEEKTSISDVVGDAGVTAAKMGAGTAAKAAVTTAAVAAGVPAVAAGAVGLAAGAGASAVVDAVAGSGNANDAMKKVGDAVGDAAKSLLGTEKKEKQD